MSYPDISLVPDICRELRISEHEFFTACDDRKARRQQKEARSWRRLVWGGQIFFFISYGIALLTCFICNLAISHRLDWFWIVLCSLMLSFCFTSLPMLIRKERVLICLMAGSVCLLLLLLSCGIYTGVAGVLSALSILAVSLALPWGIYGLWRGYGRHMTTLGLLLMTVWTYALLAVVCAVSGGSWLLSMAYPIATVSFAFVWAVYAIVQFLPCNGWLRAAAATGVAAFANPCGTMLSAWIAGSWENSLTFSEYFQWGSGLLIHTADGSVLGNRAAFAAMLGAAAVLLIVGVAVAWTRRRAKRSDDSAA